MWQCHKQIPPSFCTKWVEGSFRLEHTYFCVNSVIFFVVLSCWNLPLHYELSTFMRSINAVRFLQINQHADVVIRSYPPYLLYENKQIQMASTAGLLFCWKLVFRDKQMLRTERMHHKKTKNKWKSIWLIVFWAHTHTGRLVKPICNNKYYWKNKWIIYKYYRIARVLIFMMLFKNDRCSRNYVHKLSYPVSPRGRKLYISLLPFQCCYKAYNFIAKLNRILLIQRSTSKHHSISRVINYWYQKNRIIQTNKTHKSNEPLLSLLWT